MSATQHVNCWLIFPAYQHQLFHLPPAVHCSLFLSYTMVVRNESQACNTSDVNSIFLQTWEREECAFCLNKQTPLRALVVSYIFCRMRLCTSTTESEVKRAKNHLRSAMVAQLDGMFWFIELKAAQRVCISSGEWELC